MNLIIFTIIVFLFPLCSFAEDAISAINGSLEVISTSSGKSEVIYPGNFVKIENGIKNISQNMQEIYITDENGKKKSKSFKVSRKYLYKSIGIEMETPLNYLNSNGKNITSVAPLKVIVLEDNDQGWEHYKVVFMNKNNDIVDHKGSVIPNNLANSGYYKISKNFFNEALLTQPIKNNSKNLLTQTEIVQNECPENSYEKVILDIDSHSELHPPVTKKIRVDHSNNYSKCNAKKNRHKAYMNQIRPHLTSITSSLFDGEGQDILTCLYLRESEGWKKSAKSSTGAVGLAQFTAATADYFGDIVRGSPSYWQEKVDSQLKSNIENKRLYNQAIKKKNTGMAEHWLEQIKLGGQSLKNFQKFKYLSTQWGELNFKEKTRSFPNNNKRLIRDYFRNNNNYKNIFALSALKIKSCLYDLRQIGYKVEKRKMMYICSAAYNMGDSPFLKIIQTIDKKNSSAHNLKSWTQALENSNHKKKMRQKTI